MLQRLFIIVLLAPLGGCPDSQTIEVEDPNVVCEEGETQPCSCALGVMGTQACQEGGFFELCQCDNENPTDDNSNNPNDNNENNATGDGGITDNTGPTPPPCQDADGDGFFNCIPEGAQAGDGGTIPEELDCDDSMWHVQPGGAEVARNGIDDNCNGEIDEIENEISNGIPIKNVANNFNLNLIERTKYIINDESDPIEKKIYEMKDTEIQVFDEGNFYIVFEINNIDKVLPKKSDEKFRKKLVKILFEKKKYKYNKKILNEINTKKFTQNSFENIIQKNSIKLEKIQLNSMVVVITQIILKS